MVKNSGEKIFMRRKLKMRDCEREANLLCRSSWFFGVASNDGVKMANGRARFWSLGQTDTEQFRLVS